MTPWISPAVWAADRFSRILRCELRLSSHRCDVSAGKGVPTRRLLEWSRE